MYEKSKFYHKHRGEKVFLEEARSTITTHGKVKFPIGLVGKAISRKRFCRLPALSNSGTVATTIFNDDVLLVSRNEILEEARPLTITYIDSS